MKDPKITASETETMLLLHQYRFSLNADKATFASEDGVTLYGPFYRSEMRSENRRRIGESSILLGRYPANNSIAACVEAYAGWPRDNEHGVIVFWTTVRPIENLPIRAHERVKWRSDVCPFVALISNYTTDDVLSSSLGDEIAAITIMAVESR